MNTIYAIASEWHINFQVHITVKIIVRRVKDDKTYLINGHKGFQNFKWHLIASVTLTLTAVLLDMQIFDVLSKKLHTF